MCIKTHEWHYNMIQKSRRNILLRLDYIYNMYYSADFASGFSHWSSQPKNSRCQQMAF